jgi:hypothetical protein
MGVTSNSTADSTSSDGGEHDMFFGINTSKPVEIYSKRLIKSCWRVFLSFVSIGHAGREPT